MAFDNLFIRASNNLAGIQLDGIISESHSNPVRVSRNPIETGADITDHAVLEPVELVINAIVSDSPIGFQAVTALVDNVTGFFGSSTAPNLTRSAAAYATLIELRNQRQPLEIQTKLKLYTNMLIKDVRTTQDKSTANVLDFEIQLTELLITDTKTVAIPQSTLAEGDTQKQGATTVDRGTQSPAAPTEANAQTILKATSSWLGF